MGLAVAQVREKLPVWPHARAPLPRVAPAVRLTVGAVALGPGKGTLAFVRTVDDVERALAQVDTTLEAHFAAPFR
jgi:hypothetical protein